MAFPVLSQQGLEPGVFAQFIPSTALVNPPGGLRILCLVGTGISTATVSGEVVTKGAEDTQDELAFEAVALPATITDQNFVIYNLGLDYQLTNGDVDWNMDAAAIQIGSVSATSFAIGGQTLAVTVTTNGVPVTESLTFSGAALSLTTISGVISEINSSALTNVLVASNNGNNQVELTTNSDSNTTFQMGIGTANATLGFTSGVITKSSFEPAQGTKYTLTYSRQKTVANGDYVPMTFFDINSVLNWSGPITVDSNNNIIYSIPMAAFLAFQNGASAVMVMELNPADILNSGSLIALQNAINALQNADLNIIVPLDWTALGLTSVSALTAAYAIIKNHVDQMSSLVEQRFRTALLGLAGMPTIPQIQTLASGLKDRRIALIHPPAATVEIPNDLTPVNIDGTYLAACIGGIRVNPAFDVAEPLLRKELFGLNTISDVLLRTQKNVLANSGVMLIEYQSGVIRVRDGLTTDLTTVDSAEYSVTEIIDFVSTTCQSFLSAAFIGTKLLPDTANLVQASLNIILNSLVNSKILSDFTNIAVVQDAVNPTQLDVSFQISPIFPTKYILIQFTI